MDLITLALSKKFTSDAINEAKVDKTDIVQSDWNQNDETGTDYIKNRPFYEGEVLITYVDGEPQNVNGSDGQYRGWIEEYSGLKGIIKPGQSYNLTFDGVLYENIMCYGEEGACYLGITENDFHNDPNAEYPCSVNYTDYYDAYFIGLRDDAPHTIKIEALEFGIKQIDAKYIPSMVGKNVTGQTFTVWDPENEVNITVEAEEGAEVFNAYEINVATGTYSHAEGYQTIATYGCDHAEGYGSVARGGYSHAEGYATVASGSHSHSEGTATTASGEYSHTEGYYTEAKGNISHAEGLWTIATGNYQHAQGKYNIEDTEDKYAHIVGNGDGYGRSNAHTLDWDGNAWYQGDVFVGSTSGTNKDEGSKKLATEEYVNTEVANLVNSAPETLDTLGELATALKENSDVVEALNSAIANKADKEHTHSWNDLEDKPFYETIVEGEVLCEFNAIFDSNEPAQVVDCPIFDLTEGESYQVIIDGIEYEPTVCKEIIDYHRYKVLGNSTLYSPYLGENSGEDYAIVKDVTSAGGAVFCFVKGKANQNSTIRIIEGKTKEIVPIDEKFLPDSVFVQADWNVNDEANPAYIKNRPFYSTGEYEEIELLKDEIARKLRTFYVLMNFPALQENHTYKLILNNEEFICTAILDAENNLGLGNSDYLNNNIWEDGKESFYLRSDGTMAFIYTKDLSLASFNVSVYETKEKIHQIEKKYIEDHLVGHKAINQKYIYNDTTYVSQDGAEIFNNLGNIAIGQNSHAEGSSTVAFGEFSHAEGLGSKAFGTSSHAGGTSSAYGANSFAHGVSCIASGARAWAQNNGTEAFGNDSTAEGIETIANRGCQHVQGRYNIPEDRVYQKYIFTMNSNSPFCDGETIVYLLDKEPTFNKVDGKFTITGVTTPTAYKDLQPNNIFLFEDTTETTVDKYYFVRELLTTEDDEEGTTLYQWNLFEHNSRENREKGKYVHIVGNGTSNTERSNAYTLDWEGNAEFAGDVKVNACGGENPISLIALAEEVAKLKELMSNGLAGQFAVSDGNGGINWITLCKAEEVEY